MGIKGINPLIKRYAPKAYFTMPIYELSGKRIAIDGNNWMYTIMAIARKKIINKTDIGVQEPNTHDIRREWIFAAINFLIGWLRYNITPVVVFDGNHPPEKDETKAKRRATRMASKVKIQALYSKLKVEQSSIIIDELRKELRNYNFITSEDFELFQIILKSIGIPCLQAIGDGEQLCSTLCIEGKVAAVYSIDTDNLVYGCPLLITGLSGVCSYDEYGNKIAHLDCVRLDHILHGLQFTHSMFVDLCIMSGCDFNTNIPGYAAIKSYNLLKKCGSIENLPRNLNISCLRHIRCRELFKYRHSNELMINNQSGLTNDIINGLIRPETFNPNIQKENQTSSTSPDLNSEGINTFNLSVESIDTKGIKEAQSTINSQVEDSPENTDHRKDIIELESRSEVANLIPSESIKEAPLQPVLNLPKSFSPEKSASLLEGIKFAGSPYRVPDEIHRVLPIDNAKDLVLPKTPLVKGAEPLSPERPQVLKGFPVEDPQGGLLPKEEINVNEDCQTDKSYVDSTNSIENLELGIGLSKNHGSESVLPENIIQLENPSFSDDYPEEPIVENDKSNNEANILSSCRSDEQFEGPNKISSFLGETSQVDSSTILFAKDTGKGTLIDQRQFLLEKGKENITSPNSKDESSTIGGQIPKGFNLKEPFGFSLGVKYINSYPLNKDSVCSFPENLDINKNNITTARDYLEIVGVTNLIEHIIACYSIIRPASDGHIEHLNLAPAPRYIPPTSETIGYQRNSVLNRRVEIDGSIQGVTLNIISRPPNKKPVLLLDTPQPTPQPAVLPVNDPSNKCYEIYSGRSISASIKAQRAPSNISETIIDRHKVDKSTSPQSIKLSLNIIQPEVASFN